MTNKDFSIGYKKPPRSTQFQPGQSGNPAGRPKGIKNLATDLKEELEEKITITENGTPLEITKQRAMLKTLMAKALKGDSRASSVLIGLAISMEQADSSQHTVHVFPEEDLAIIENLKARLKDTSDQPLSEENNDETDSE